MSEAWTTSSKKTPQDDKDNLNPLQRQRVDQSFESLFGYQWDAAEGLLDTELLLPEEQAKASASSSTRVEEKNAVTEQHGVLVEILGRRAAARLLRSHRHLANAKLVVRQHQHRKRQNYKMDTSRSILHVPVSRFPTIVNKSANTSKVSSSISRPQSTIVETKAAPVPTKRTPAPAAAVDNLLQQLTGPNKVSTVAKTHSDWDQFKETTGLTETLEEQADSKTAFLKKQDFLQRVDHRTFEKEKQERDRERAKRGN